MKAQRFGLQHWLVSDVDPLELLPRIEQAAQDAELAEWAPGYETVLLRFQTRRSQNEVDDFLQGLATCGTASESKQHLLEVDYSGEDLQSVAVRVGLTEAEVVRLHTAGHYRVRLLGFAPGFGYLEGLDPRLHVSRRARPRPRIEPGTVAIGGSHTGVYSVATPGGWNCLGTTSTPLFRPADQENPFLLAPGDYVRFAAI